MRLAGLLPTPAPCRASRRQPVGLAAANEQRQDFVYLQADNAIGHRQDPPAEPEVEVTG